MVIEKDKAKEKNKESRESELRGEKIREEEISVFKKNVEEKEKIERAALRDVVEKDTRILSTVENAIKKELEDQKSIIARRLKSRKEGNAKHDRAARNNIDEFLKNSKSTADVVKNEISDQGSNIANRLKMRKAAKENPEEHANKALNEYLKSLDLLNIDASGITSVHDFIEVAITDKLKDNVAFHAPSISESLSFFKVSKDTKLNNSLSAYIPDQGTREKVISNYVDAFLGNAKKHDDMYESLLAMRSAVSKKYTQEERIVSDKEDSRSFFDSLKKIKDFSIKYVVESENGVKLMKFASTFRFVGKVFEKLSHLLSTFKNSRFFLKDAIEVNNTIVDSVSRYINGKANSDDVALLNNVSNINENQENEKKLLSAVIDTAVSNPVRKNIDALVDAVFGSSEEKSSVKNDNSVKKDVNRDLLSKVISDVFANKTIGISKNDVKVKIVDAIEAKFGTMDVSNIKNKTFEKILKLSNTLCVLKELRENYKISKEGIRSK